MVCGCVARVPLIIALGSVKCVIACVFLALFVGIYLRSLYVCLCVKPRGVNALTPAVSNSKYLNTPHLRRVND